MPLPKNLSLCIVQFVQLHFLLMATAGAPHTKHVADIGDRDRFEVDSKGNMYWPDCIKIFTVAATMCIMLHGYNGPNK